MTFIFGILGLIPAYDHTDKIMMSYSNIITFTTNRTQANQSEGKRHQLKHRLSRWQEWASYRIWTNLIALIIILIEP